MKFVSAGLALIGLFGCSQEPFEQERRDALAMAQAAVIAEIHEHSLVSFPAMPAYDEFEHTVIDPGEHEGEYWQDRLESDSVTFDFIVMDVDPIEGRTRGVVVRGIFLISHMPNAEWKPHRFDVRANLSDTGYEKPWKVHTEFMGER